MTKSKVKKGKIGELIVIENALFQGLEIFTSVTEDSKVDLIILHNHRPYKIQVKIIGMGEKVQVRKLSHSKTQHKVHYYTCEEIDYFIAVNINTKEFYVIDCVTLSLIKSSISETTLKKLYVPNTFPFMEPNIRNIVSGEDNIGESYGNGNSEGMK